MSWSFTYLKIAHLRPTDSTSKTVALYYTYIYTHVQITIYAYILYTYQYCYHYHYNCYTSLSLNNHIYVSYLYIDCLRSLSPCSSPCPCDPCRIACFTADFTEICPACLTDGLEVSTKMPPRPVLKIERPGSPQERIRRKFQQRWSVFVSWFEIMIKGYFDYCPSHDRNSS